MRRAFERLAQSTHPPKPVSVVWVDAPSHPQPAVVPVGAARSLREAVGSMRAAGADLGVTDVLLIPDLRRKGALPIRGFEAIAAELRGIPVTTIGLSPTIRASVLERWQVAAANSGANVTVLGQKDWQRIVFSGLPTVLEYCDVPAELRSERAVIALCAPAGDGVVRIWRDYVHPNSALRARLVAGALGELAVAIPARYLVAGRVGTMWLAGVAAEPVAAELLGRGIERLRDRQRGIEGPGPWEDALVQHLAQLGMGVAVGSELVLRVSPAGEMEDDTASQLRELLGCRLEVVGGADEET